MTPRGKPLTQARVRELASGPGVIVLCGRFEGVDERLIAARNIEEVSIGDFVLAGGDEPDQTGWFTLIWLRTAAGWRAGHDHSS